MRIFVRVIAGLLVTLGVIWILQGVGLLPLSGARRARHP